MDDSRERDRHEWTILEKLVTFGTQDTRRKTNKTKKKHNAICDGHHCTETNTHRVNMTWTLLQTNTNRVNMTWTLLQTIGDKDEPNIVLMWTSQHGTNLLECKDT